MGNHLPSDPGASRRQTLVEQLERVRALLFELEHRGEPVPLLERIQTVRLEIDRVIEELRSA
jgi:hypothetical protein